MNLITVLIALAIETYFGDFDKYRSLNWFERYNDWLESRAGRAAYWDGVVGLLITLFIPLFLLGLAVYLSGKVHFVLGFIFSLLVLIYSFGPAVNSLLDKYIDALAANDEGLSRAVLKQILVDADGDETDHERVISSIMLRAHEYLFAIIFWFFILGAVGAFLYCLVINLSGRYKAIHGGYADAVRDLHDLLMWPSARLLALGFALGGNLIGAFEGWKKVSGNTLNSSSEVVTASGLGALQYPPENEKGPDDDGDMFLAWFNEALALINRTLIVWLIVLGVMTIVGWIA